MIIRPLFTKVKNKSNITATTTDIFLLLYVDNGALPFVSREDTILSTNISFKTMARLGLNMHVGTKDKYSKIEAVYFPSRTKLIDWFKKMIKNFSLWCPILVT